MVLYENTKSRKYLVHFGVIFVYFLLARPGVILSWRDVALLGQSLVNI